MNNRTTIRVVVILILTASVVLSAVAAALIDHNYYERSSKNMREQLRYLAAEIDQATISGNRIGVTQALGLTNRRIRETVLGEHAPDNAAVMSVLLKTRASLQASIVYIMDPTGRVVACTPYGKGGLMYGTAGKTLTGKEYHFRPYFLRAISGRSAIYLALGATTRERGIYYSSPIYDNQSGPSKTPIGVIVIKADLDAIDSILAQQNDYVALTSPDGIVFASNHKEWIFHSTAEVGESALLRIRRSRQFADRFDNTPPVVIPEIKTHTRCFIYDGEPTNIEDAAGTWCVIGLARTMEDYPYSITTGAILLILLTGGLLSLVLVFQMQRRHAQAEQQLVTESAAITYESIFNATSDAIFLLNPVDCMILEANAQAVSIFELKPDVPIPFFALDAHDMDPESADLTQRITRATNDAQTFEYPMSSCKGRVFWCEITIRRRVISGQQRILVVATDIQRRKEIEQEFIRSERLAAVGTLAAGVAHEFNNINVTILGYAQLAEEKQSDDPQMRTFITRILDGARRAREVTHRLLDFSSPKKAVLRAGEISTMLESALLLVEPEFRGKGIDVCKYIVETPPVIVDAELIGQVILNLLINASHAMLESETKTLTVTTGSEEDAVWFTISDTGCGIDNKEISRIFSPFYTTKGEFADSGSPMSKVRGSGLGLSVSHTIIEKHGGSIDVSSQPGEGTTFRISLPMRPADMTEAPTPDATKPSAPTPPAAPVVPGNIVILEDEADTRKLIEIFVKRNGHTVRTDENPTTILGWIENGGVDILLLDVLIPGSDVHEFLDRLRQIPAAKRPAVILITGQGMDQLRDLLALPEVNDAIQKPFTLDTIREVLQRVLAEHRLHHPDTGAEGGAV